MSNQDAINALRRVSPMCAICGKTVERLSVYEDQSNFTLVFTAYCHGDMEVTTIEPLDIMRADLSPGVAFQTKKVQK